MFKLYSPALAHCPSKTLTGTLQRRAGGVQAYTQDIEPTLVLHTPQQITGAKEQNILLFLVEGCKQWSEEVTGSEFLLRTEHHHISCLHSELPLARSS